VSLEIAQAWIGEALKRQPFYRYVPYLKNSSVYPYSFTEGDRLTDLFQLNGFQDGRDARVG